MAQDSSNGYTALAELIASRPVVTVEEAAKILRISRATAYSLVKAGQLGAIRISKRRIIIPWKAIEDLLASTSIKAKVI